MKFENKWYTPQEIAKLLQVCPQTVRNWIRGIFSDHGQTRAYRELEPLKASKIVGKYRVWGPDLAQFLEASRC